MKRRTKIPQKTADGVLASNNHTCCICREPRKHVVIHHIDSDPSNNAPANLAVVCHDCHSRVTGDEGLGRPFSVREVTQYKQRWERQCAHSVQASEQEEPEEPVYTLYEVKRIRTDEHELYDFEMNEGDDLIISVSADDYIDISVCTPADYKRWLKTAELRAYVSAAEVRKRELSFTAPREGTYYLLLVNESDEDVEAKVDAAVWSGEE